MGPRTASVPRSNHERQGDIIAKSKMSLPEFEERAALLESTRTRKMAQSPHRYVRGNTSQFYEWLGSSESVGVKMRLPFGCRSDCCAVPPLV